MCAEIQLETALRAAAVPHVPHNTRIETRLELSRTRTRMRMRMVVMMMGFSRCAQRLLIAQRSWTCGLKACSWSCLEKTMC